MIEIFIAESLEYELEDAVSAVRTAVQATLAQAQMEAATLSLLLTDDAELHQMNRDYRAEDRPTDVLSFEAGDELGGYLGDIAISVETAVTQAETAGHELVEELQLLAVHGTLHLLGYDHGTVEEKDEMWGQQTAVLDQLNLSHVTPTEAPHS
ncbi:MAG: rRNA maturation RNase YbeY [Chloroflexi bacterium]|nr:MAG: rRNA maturation RNase YbeY [Chloroflexota bacterium]